MKYFRLSIAELADAGGISRRAVRFYVARGLLPSPEGKGRGGFYTALHLQQLQKIQELQRAGHPLEAIRRILSGQPAPALPARVRPLKSKAGIQAALWTRVVLTSGIELHVDTRHSLSAEQIMALGDCAGKCSHGRRTRFRTD